jgi:hypothetical protein
VTASDVENATQLMAAGEAEVQFGVSRPSDHSLRRRVARRRSSANRSLSGISRSEEENNERRSVRHDAVLDTERRFTEAAERFHTGADGLNLVRGRRAINLMPVALTVATER